MAKNYFHLKLPFKDPLSEKGMQWFFDLPPCFIQVPNQYFNPEAVEFFKKHKLLYWDAEVFSFPANYTMEIHVDAVEFTEKETIIIFGLNQNQLGYQEQLTENKTMDVMMTTATPLKKMKLKKLKELL